MSFLDNLENSLKSLESQEERGPGEQQRRKEDQARALAIAPWAETLKNSPYTQKLYQESTIAGHRIRTKIYIAWLDSTLQLEAKSRTLRLEPTPDGIVAKFTSVNGEDIVRAVDLAGNPTDLLQEWLG